MISDFFDTLGRIIDGIIIVFFDTLFKIGFVIYEWWGRLLGLAVIGGILWVVYKIVYFFLRFYFPHIFGKAFGN